MPRYLIPDGKKKITEDKILNCLYKHSSNDSDRDDLVPAARLVCELIRSAFDDHASSARTLFRDLLAAFATRLNFKSEITSCLLTSQDKVRIQWLSTNTFTFQLAIVFFQIKYLVPVDTSFVLRKRFTTDLQDSYERIRVEFYHGAESYSDPNCRSTSLWSRTKGGVRDSRTGGFIHKICSRVKDNQQKSLDPRPCDRKSVTNQYLSARMPTKTSSCPFFDVAHCYAFNGIPLGEIYSSPDEHKTTARIIAPLFFSWSKQELGSLAELIKPEWREQSRDMSYVCNQYNEYLRKPSDFRFPEDTQVPNLSHPPPAHAPMPGPATHPHSVSPSTNESVISELTDATAARGCSPANSVFPASKTFYPIPMPLEPANSANQLVLGPVHPKVLALKQQLAEVKQQNKQLIKQHSKEKQIRDSALVARCENELRDQSGEPDSEQLATQENHAVKKSSRDLQNQHLVSFVVLCLVVFSSIVSTHAFFSCAEEQFYSRHELDWLVCAFICYCVDICPYLTNSFRPLDDNDVSHQFRY